MATKTVRKRARRRKINSVSDSTVAEEEKSVQATLAQQRREALKEQYLKKLDENMGLMTQTARDLGISRRTPERWRVEDPEFNERVLEIQCGQRNFVEAKLIEQINAGNIQGIMFYLRCKGRGRDVPEDWIERREIAGAPDAPLSVNANVAVVRDEVSDTALIKAMAKAMASAPELFDNEEGEDGKGG